MFDARLNTLSLYYAAGPSEANRHSALLHGALGRFDNARRAATVTRVKNLLFGRVRRLLNLAAIPSGQVRGRHYAGIRSVSLDQICGSLDRTGDFDHLFQPLTDRLRDRWISIAMARSQDVPLPAVSLVQVGDCYFVEDGHHRVSVARAMGDGAVDAEITVWDVRGPLPWERRPAPQPVWQAASR